MGTKAESQKKVEKKKEGSVLRKKRNQGKKWIYEHRVSDYGPVQ